VVQSGDPVGGSDPLFAGVMFGAWSVGPLRREPEPAGAGREHAALEGDQGSTSM
jgi:hypothetical protein